MNPAELAQPFSEILMLQGTLDSDYSGRFEQDQLETLESLADQQNMLDQKYFVYARKAFITPDVPETNRTKWQTDELGFTGNLLSYSAVRTPRIIGRGSVRAVCLTFNDVTILPDLRAALQDEQYGFETDEVLVHVPAFAVEGMGNLAA